MDLFGVCLSSPSPAEWSRCLAVLVRKTGALFGCLCVGCRCCKCYDTCRGLPSDPGVQHDKGWLAGSSTGEGQVGDMQLTKGNLSIANHALDGRALHVFESLGKGKGQKYIGEFTYVNHSIQRGPDREGNDRQIIVFHLVPVGTEAHDLPPEEVEEIASATPTLDLDEARKRALSAFGANEGIGGKEAKKKLYIRSRAVRDYVLLRSRGECESCHEPAPFKRIDGSPYLEPHHTTRVSDGGLDHPRFVGAICPTCHREIHHGLDGKRRNAELTEYLAEIEPIT